jgi:hypothetical protein
MGEIRVQAIEEMAARGIGVNVVFEIPPRVLKRID